jgi:hypothetical protein
MRSRRRIFRRKTSPIRWLGMITLIFAGSFAATVITFDWPDASLPHAAQNLGNPTLVGAGGLLARTPVMRLAATSPGTSPEHR